MPGRLSADCRLPGSRCPEPGLCADHFAFPNRHAAVGEKFTAGIVSLVGRRTAVLTIGPVGVDIAVRREENPAIGILLILQRWFSFAIVPMFFIVRVESRTGYAECLSKCGALLREATG